MMLDYSDDGAWWPPRSAIAHDGIEDDEQLSRHRDQSFLFWCAALEQAAVKSRQGWVPVRSTERGHVQCAAYVAASAADHLTPAPLPALTYEGRQSCEAGQAPAVGAPEFRQLGDQHERGGLADSRHALMHL